MPEGGASSENIRRGPARPPFFSRALRNQPPPSRAPASRKMFSDAVLAVRCARLPKKRWKLFARDILRAPAVHSGKTRTHPFPVNRTESGSSVVLPRSPRNVTTLAWGTLECRPHFVQRQPSQPLLIACRHMHIPILATSGTFRGMHFISGMKNKIK